MKFVFFEFGFSFLSRVPPILGSMPSNVLMFGYHHLCTTHIKKAYLQGTVLLHFKHLKSLHSEKRILCLQGIFIFWRCCKYPKFTKFNFRVISASPPQTSRTGRKCIYTRDSWWLFCSKAKKGIENDPKPPYVATCFSPKKLPGLTIIQFWLVGQRHIRSYMSSLFLQPGKNPKLRHWYYHCPT